MNQPTKAIATLAIVIGIAFVLKECGHVTRVTTGLKSKFLMMGSVGGDLESPKVEEIAQREEPLLPVEDVPPFSEPLPQPVEKKKKRARIASTKPVTTDASVMEAVRTEPLSTSDIQIGLDMTSGFIAPTIRYEYALTPQMVVGAHFSYTKNFFSDPYARLWGGGASLSYYVLGRAFEGLSIDGEFSTYDIQATTPFRQSHITPSTLAARASWHGSLAKHFNYTIGAGPQYVHLWGQDNGDIEYRAWAPAFRVSLGYDF